MTGEVIVDGLNTRSTPMHVLARRIGIVLQNPEAQFFGETVEEELAFGPENLGLPVAEIERRIAGSLARVGMSGLEQRYPFHLSGGQKQRVAIAVALAMEPDMLVMDEPTSELDPNGKAEVLQTIRRLNREHGRTVVLITHETDELVQIADRIVLLSAEGRMLAVGTPAEVLGGDDPERHGVRQPQLFALWRALDRADIATPPVTVEDAAARLRSAFHPAPPAASASSVPRGAPLISCRGLSHVFPTGVRALAAIDLDIASGEFVAIMGQNGSGKTTLTKHFNGLLRATRGSVIVAGRDVANETTASMARLIGYAFQNPDHQLFAQTVAAEFAFGLRNIGVPDAEILARTREVLARSELDVAPDAYPHFLGKGERQKLALATILAMRPDILIIDEPTTGQDWRSAASTMDTLRQLNREGRTVIIVTHDTRLAAEYAARVVVMAKGAIVADGPPADIFYDRVAMAAGSLLPPPIVALASALAPADSRPGVLTVDAFRASLGAAP
jgi:energy-coupling factor transporter ATP-binding protein EcfA2